MNRLARAATHEMMVGKTEPKASSEEEEPPKPKDSILLRHKRDSCETT